MNPSELFKGFSQQKVLILGDCMIDAYFFGNVERISPEAPVPIVNLNKKEYRLGGAANVALNIKALGASPILVSVIGNDREGNVLRDLMDFEGLSPEGLISENDRITTVKTRVIGNGHQMLRIDDEHTNEIQSDTEEEIFNYIEKTLSDIDVLVFQDYNKGLLSKKLIGKVIDLAKARQVKTVVDPKFDHFFDYKGVDLFKPNRKEIAQAYNLARIESSEEILDLARTLRKDIDAQAVLITLSEGGVAILSEGNTEHLPAHKRKIVDVSGAGDSALSAAALCLGAGFDQKTIAELANLAGGLVCEKLGVVPIDADDLRSELERLS